MKSHSVTELGIFDHDGASYRWIALAGENEETLQRLVASAAAKGWTHIPFLEGREPGTNWPSIWMEKPRLLENS